MREKSFRSYMTATALLLLCLCLLSTPGHLQEAKAHGIMPMIMTGGAAATNTSWSNWDGVTESGWGDDEWISLCESGASQNETAMCPSMSGAELVMTQAGAIAAATGSPPTRYVDRSGGDYFSVHQSVVNRLNGKTFTYIAYCNQLSVHGGILEFYDGTRHLFVDTDGRFYTSGYTTNSDVSWASSPTTPTGNIYFVLFDDGTNTYWGWCTTKPTKLSDIPSTQRVSKTSIDGTQSGSSRKAVLGSDSTSTSVKIYGYYVLVSDECLIDTTS